MNLIVYRSDPLWSTIDPWSKYMLTMQIDNRTWPDSLASHDRDVDTLACAPSPTHTHTHTDETTSTCLKTLCLIGNMAAAENQCSCWRLRLPWWRGGGPLAAIQISYASFESIFTSFMHELMHWPGDSTSQPCFWQIWVCPSGEWDPPVCSSHKTSCNVIWFDIHFRYTRCF